MIYIVAPNASSAREWCGVKGMDPDSVVIVTKKEHAQGRRLGATDKIETLPGSDPDLFFELTVHIDRQADIPSNPRLW